MKRKFIGVIIFSLIVILGLTIFAGKVFAATDSSNTTNTSSEAEETNNDSSKGLGLIAAALATGIGSIGAGIAVAVVVDDAIVVKVKTLSY